MAVARRVFISYAHGDEAIRQELGKTLRPLEREGKIEIWHDRKIAPGADWHEEISNRLDRSFDALASMQQIQRCLEETAVAFQAQARQRDELVGWMRGRLGIADQLEFERFFRGSARECID